jgi:hypothetical protein
MIEFGDPEVRAQRLREMRGIENCINLEIEGMASFRSLPMRT